MFRFRRQGRGQARTGRGLCRLLMGIIQTEQREMIVPENIAPIDVRMMERALELARRAAEQDEVPVGAVVYRGEQIVGEGFNLRESDRDPTAHAEIVAIRRAAKVIGHWRLDQCSMVVTLEPCPMCAGALVNARLERLIFGATDPKAGAVETLYQLCDDQRLNHRMDVVGGLMEEECGDLLREFFRSKRRRRESCCRE